MSRPGRSPHQLFNVFAKNVRLKIDPDTLTTGL